MREGAGCKGVRKARKADKQTDEQANVSEKNHSGSNLHHFDSPLQYAEIYKETTTDTYRKDLPAHHAGSTKS